MTSFLLICFLCLQSHLVLSFLAPPSQRGFRAFSSKGLERRQRLQVQNVFDFSSIETGATAAALAVVGLLPYFILQFVAPKLGLVDEKKAREGIKDGEEPWL